MTIITILNNISFIKKLIWKCLISLQYLIFKKKSEIAIDMFLL